MAQAMDNRPIERAIDSASGGRVEGSTDGISDGPRKSK